MEKSSVIVMRLPEFFDAKRARKLRRDLAGKITVSSPVVIVDLSRLKRMDSAGLETLVELLDVVAKRDGKLQLSNMSPEAEALLELTRVGNLLSKFPGFSVEAPVVALTPEQVPEESEEEEGPVQLPAVA